MSSFQEIVFRLKNRLFRGKSNRVWKRCNDYINKSAAERGDKSFTLRRKLVEEAYSNSPFYREYYDIKGFHPDMLKYEADWDKVPVLEKSMIRERCDELFTKNADRKKHHPSQTGGSTGKPLVVYKSEDVSFEVLHWRALGYYGIGPWDNEAIVHRRVPESLMARLKNRMMWWPTRRAYLSATSISDEEIDRFVSEIIRKRIKWVVGYCGSLEYIADYILRKGIRIDSVKLVWSTSSPLTDIVRRKLESAFNCQVMDQYGCCEMGNIAVQKPGENCLTVNSDYVHVDIVDGDRIVDAGVDGDICITDLYNTGFPLIKYRLGDRARILKPMAESPDGFPKMSFVKGRITDMLPLPSGKVLDGSFLTTICDSYYENISCYQIYQKADYNIVFFVIPKNGNEADMEIIDTIRKRLVELTEGCVDVAVKITDRIDDFAGKRKFIVSEVALAGRG